MTEEDRQLQRNRGKVALIAFGLLLLGSNEPNIGRMFDDNDHHRGSRSEHFEDKIDKIIAKIEQAVEKAAEKTERKSGGISLRIEF